MVTGYPDRIEIGSDFFMVFLDFKQLLVIMDTYIGRCSSDIAYIAEIFVYIATMGGQKF